MSENTQSKLVAESEIVVVPARELKPYHYAVWSRHEGGQPFLNPIVGIRWSDDGASITCMLDSHNFLFIDPEDDVEIVVYADPADSLMRAKYADWKLPPKPVVKKTYAQLEAALAAAEKERDAAHALLRECLREEEWPAGLDECLMAHLEGKR